MNSVRNPLINVSRCLVFAALVGAPAQAFAQVRTKKPDRGVYQPPTIESVTKQDDGQSLSKLIRAGGDINLTPPPRRTQRSQPSQRDHATWGPPLVDAEFSDGKRGQPVSVTRPQARVKRTTPEQNLQNASSRQPLRDPTRVLKTDSIQLDQPHRPRRIGDDVVITGGQEWVEDGEVYYEGSYAPVIEPSCGACGGCDSCDSCCESMGSYNYNKYCNAANAWLSLAPDRWFASAELMLMFRKGDGLPPLVTTSNDPDAVDDPPPGALGRDDTVVLSGDELIFKNMTAGGRFTVGTWLDCQRCRSLVARGWFAGEKRYRFSADEDGFPVLARPFLNVDDGTDPTSDRLLIAEPDLADGSVSVLGRSDVYGADISVRQLWYGRYGGTVDVLYGYQFMGVNENLGIGSTSISLDEDIAPVGTVITVNDLFDVRNEFHGGQIGLASNYREGCWSFKGLFKLGFGGLNRRARLVGQNTRSLDGVTSVDNENGLLVRSTNAGDYNDTEFAWSPELNLSLGWQYFPMFDVTLGYHLVALTDALQVSGTIDPELAVNAVDPPLEAQRPAAIFRTSTYYVQGIQFGIQYVY